MKASFLPVCYLSLACFAACLGLGFFVRGRPTTRFDLAARVLRGRGTAAAAVFTMLGRWYSILAIAIAVAISSALCGASPLPIATLLGSQLLAQGVVELLKRSFRRVRPDYWLVRQERDLSYPSGHATTAIVFFVPLVALVSVGHVVPQIAAVPVACALALCVFGIPWSRLVLGAHYPTDVAGGVLFGTGWLAASLAVLGSR